MCIEDMLLGINGLATVVLATINGVLIVLGMSMIIIGAVFTWMPHTTKIMFGQFLDDLHIDASSDSITEIISRYTSILIIFGVIIFCMSMLGFVASFSDSPLLHKVYIAVYGIIFLVQVIFLAVAVIKKDMFANYTKPSLKVILQKNFVGISGTDPTSQMWNGLMAALQCCGVDSYSDFTGASKWNTTSMSGGTLLTPVFCCKNVTTAAATDYACAMNGTADSTTSNMDMGCYQRIWEHMYTFKSLVVYYLSFVLAGELIVLILACLLLITSHRNEGSDSTDAEHKDGSSTGN